MINIPCFNFLCQNLSKKSLGITYFRFLALRNHLLSKKSLVPYKKKIILFTTGAGVIAPAGVTSLSVTGVILIIGLFMQLDVGELATGAQDTLFLTLSTDVLLSLISGAT